MAIVLPAVAVVAIVAGRAVGVAGWLALIAQTTSTTTPTTIAPRTSRVFGGFGLVRITAGRDDKGRAYVLGGLGVRTGVGAGGALAVGPLEPAPSAGILEPHRSQNSAADVAPQTPQVFVAIPLPSTRRKDPFVAQIDHHWDRSGWRPCGGLYIVQQPTGGARATGGIVRSPHRVRPYLPRTS